VCLSKSPVTDIQFCVFFIAEMDRHHHDDSSYVGEDPVYIGTTCSAVDNLTSYHSADITLPNTDNKPDSNSDIRRTTMMIRDFPSENNANTSEHNCKSCTPSETDSSCDCHVVTPNSNASCDETLSSLECPDTSLPANALTADDCTEHVSHSVDGELQLCAPVFAVGGAREKELKRGLEQRLGLVLSKLARDTEDAAENVDDQQQCEQLEMVSGHFDEDDEPEPGETGTDSCTTTDSCSEADDIQNVLMMDIVQEMDEVERYSYVSLVAYAMHQLFEYSAWNRYVILCLLTVHF